MLIPTEYKKIAKTLRKIANKNTPFSYLYKTEASLSEALSIKAQLGQKTRRRFSLRCSVRKSLDFNAGGVLGDALAAVPPVRPCGEVLQRTVQQLERNTEHILHLQHCEEQAAGDLHLPRQQRERRALL